MIILLLIIGAVAFFWTMVLMKPNRRRPLAIAVSALLIMIPVVLLSLNDLYHIGFTIDETTELQPLAPMNDQYKFKATPSARLRNTWPINIVFQVMQRFIPLNQVLPSKPN